MAELNSNYDEDSLYCPECGQYGPECTCGDCAEQMREEALADEAAEGIEEKK